MREKTSTILLILLALVLECRSEEGLVRREWKIDGVTREALVHLPATTNPAPLLFVFHGHGGNMNQAARSFGFHLLWPEALVIYPQGLTTPGRLTDPEGKRPGWQKDIGDQADRDLKFFDTALESLEKEHRADPRRIYSTGHSNGGAFSYLLWAARGSVLAAVAPSSAVIPPQLTARLTPKPIMHVAGENDPLVRFAWQELMINAVLKINQCGEGSPWAENCTRYPSRVHTPVVTFIHHGTHTFPREAPALIVRFFKELPLGQTPALTAPKLPLAPSPP